MERPGPVIDDLNEPFFRAAGEGRLLVQRCLRCGGLHHYPRFVCPDCAGRSLEWVAACGRGSILSFSWVHKPQHPAFEDDVPIPFVAVELDEGPVIFSRLEDPPPDRIRIGARVQAGAGADGLPTFSLAD